MNNFLDSIKLPILCLLVGKSLTAEFPLLKEPE
jgi:hypothetical protein